MILYSPVEVAKLLEINDSSLRKYSLLLEVEGFKFYKRTNGQRHYTDDDILAFKKFNHFKDNDKMLLKDAAAAVLLWQNEQSETKIQPIVPDVLIEPKDGSIRLIEMIQQQQHERLQRIDKQLIADKNVQDRHEHLLSQVIQQLETMDEVNQQTAATVDISSKEWKHSFFKKIAYFKKG